MNRTLASAMGLALLLGRDASDLPPAKGGGVRSFDKKNNVKWDRAPMPPLSLGRRAPSGRVCPKDATHGHTRKRYCPTCKARFQPPKR